MNRKESLIIAGILLLISIMTTIDIVNDAREGIVWWHLFTEASVAIIALVGVYYLLSKTFKLEHSLESERQFTSKLQNEASNWKEHSKKYLDGLSSSINEQLCKWELTAAEKEVAFLLIKGFSLKEIADYRGTTEKTARTQSATIYAKAGLTGRSQLAAFFLEDLLIPTSTDLPKKD